jgi:hypothetical protein
MITVVARTPCTFSGHTNNNRGRSDVKKIAFLIIVFLLSIPMIPVLRAQTPTPYMPPPAGVGAPAAPAMGIGVSAVPSYEVKQVVDAGSWAASALEWVMTAFGGIAGTVLTAWLVKLFQKAGIDLTDAMKQQLQAIVINGLNSGAAKAESDLQGKAPIEIKNATVANAVAYTQAHGGDLMKKMGLDPTSGEAVEAIKARIATAVADPNTPTPAVMDPPAQPDAPKAA